jgi:AbrB family looped-hinge helix DNA binding protein
MKTTKVDKRGRVVIPKDLREKAKLKEGTILKITATEKGIVLEPLESIADKYFGAFKVTHWPEDLDEFVVKAMRGWWEQKGSELRVFDGHI